MKIDKKTKEIEAGLDAMTATELIKLYSQLEEIKQGYEDTFGVVVGGHAFCCNTHRTESQYTLDGEAMEKEQFFKLQEQARLSLVCQHDIIITSPPPHKRRPKKQLDTTPETQSNTWQDGVINLPRCFWDTDDE